MASNEEKGKLNADFAEIIEEAKKLSEEDRKRLAIYINGFIAARATQVKEA